MHAASTVLMVLGLAMCVAASWVRLKNLRKSSRKAPLWDLIIAFNVSGFAYMAVGGFHWASKPANPSMDLAFSISYFVLCAIPMYVYVIRSDKKAP